MRSAACWAAARMRRRCSTTEHSKHFEKSPRGRACENPMSEPEEELELQALQRQLDDAFETTRPRTGFEDELWLRMQSSRPAPSRLRDAFAGFFQVIREVPAVPAGAVAVLLVVVIGGGTVALSGLGRHGGGANSSTAGGANLSAPDAGQLYAGNFGRVPTPMLHHGAKSSTSAQPTAVHGASG